MNLLRTILSSVWMIDEPTLRSAIPFVAALARGENVSFEQETADLRPYALWQQNQVRYYNYNDAPPESVAVHTLIGTVVKYGGYCSSGTEDLMRQMAKADQHANIGGHLIEIDSGGGEATNIETVARFIRNDIKKPVLAWFNGTCASAAFYIAAATDEIYASEPTDIVGSLGTMISFADFRAFYEEQGIKLHEIYADQSQLKNLDFQQALAGDYKRLKEHLLNPYAQTFIDTVKEFRPQLREEDAYKGEVYMTAQAIQIGMIDGQCTFAEAVVRLQELIQTRSLNHNTTNMTFQRIEALLGTPIEVHDGGAFLRVDELQQIDRNLVAEGDEAVPVSELQRLTSSIDGFSQTLTALRADVTANSTAIQAQGAEIERIGGEPGAKPSDVATSTDTDSGVNTDTPDDAMARLAAAANNGERVEA